MIYLHFMLKGNHLYLKFEFVQAPPLLPSIFTDTADGPAM